MPIRNSRVKAKVQKPKSRTAAAVRLTKIRVKLGENYTQAKLAEKLGVAPSAVARWEAATGKNPYEPNPQMLLRFADLLARYDGHEEDCLWLLDQAKVTPKILAVHDRLRGRSEEVVVLPVMDHAGEPLAASGALVELPASIVRDPASALCLMTCRNTGHPFMGPPSSDRDREVIYMCQDEPAEPGLLIIDKSKTDLDILRREGLPVAVHYPRLASAAFVSLPPFLGRVAEGAEIVVGKTDLLESLQREAPDMDVWDKPGIRLGWLARLGVGEALDYLLLWSATVPGLMHGAGLRVTRPRARTAPGDSEPPWELLKGLRVLGQVVMWIPRWTPGGALLREG